MGGRTSAALYLASQSAVPGRGGDRVLETAHLLRSRSRRPLLSGALLATAHPRLSPAELVDWVGKSTEAATRWQLASQEAEFVALGTALIEGLPRSTFAGAEAAGPEPRQLATASTLLALHAWLYRPVVDPAFEQEIAAAQAASP